MFNSSKNQVFIVENSEEELDSPDAYVAYSKNGTVTVSDSRRILEICLNT